MFFKLFNNYLRPPVLLLGLAEAAVIFGAVFAAVAFHWQQDAIALGIGSTAIWPKAAVVTLTVFVSLLALGLYQFHQRLYFKDALARVGVAFLLASFPLAAIWYALPEFALGRPDAQLAVVVAFAGLTSVRLFFMRTVDENIFRRRTLIYGTGEKAAAIHDIRRRADRRGFKLVGSVSPRGAGGLAASGRGIEHDKSLLEIALERGAGEVVVAIDDRRGMLPVNELLACKVRGIDVLDLVAFLERETGKIRIDLVNPSWMIFSSGFRISALRRCTKRALDLVVSTLVLIGA